MAAYLTVLIPMQRPDRIAVFAAVCILVITAVSATSMQEPEFDPEAAEDGEQLKKAADAYNKQVDELPGYAKRVVGDERINANISVTSVEDIEADYLVYGIVMDGAKIDRVNTSALDDPTLTVYTSAETLEAIAKADNPKQRALRAFNGDGIQYEAHTLMNRIRFGLLSVWASIKT